jgi:hypothetical protein
MGISSGRFGRGGVRVALQFQYSLGAPRSGRLIGPSLLGTEGLGSMSGPHNKALHQTRRQGVPASRAVVEGRLAGEGRCSTGMRWSRVYGCEGLR